MKSRRMAALYDPRQYRYKNGDSIVGPGADLSFIHIPTQRLLNKCRAYLLDEESASPGAYKRFIVRCHAIGEPEAYAELYNRRTR